MIYIKKFWIALISLVGIFILYGFINLTITLVKKDYLVHNTKSTDFDSTIFETNSDYYIYKNKFPKNYPEQEPNPILGSNYLEIDGNHEIIQTYQGLSNTLLTEESGSVTYAVEVSEAGFYRVLLTYFPTEGKSSDIERAFYLNDEIPFDSASNIIFLRTWGNEGEIKQDIFGNDIRPRQIEKPRWINAYLKDPAGYVAEPYEFYFEKGVNHLKLESLREPMVIGKIELKSVKELPSYENVKASYLQKGYQKVANEFQLVQAEQASMTTAPTLYPLNDRSSPLTIPSDPSKIKLNSIGGINWRVAGSMIEWELDVPETGLYEISLRVKQKLATGMTVFRNIYLDDEIPFKELQNYEFVHSNKWRIQTLGTKKEAFLFYLEKGKHTLKMETSLGQYGLLISEVNHSINNLNRIYREILIFTGTKPDEYRDYRLHERIPDLLARFEAERDALKRVRQGIIQISGSKSEKTGILDTVLLQLDNFLKKPSEIHKKLTHYENNIASLGTLLVLLDQQPLEIDYFIIHSSKEKMPKGSESLFETLWFGLKSFVASFTIDYSAVGTTTTESGESIDVWISVGRDQTNILRRLIDEQFTPNQNIQVNLKHVSGAALLPATLAGEGPDVALGVGSNVPVNYAMRNAAYDLSQFTDFNAISTQFHESAMVPFRYLDKTYALPETQTFLVMFYRTDIFEELDLKVPSTWEEMIGLIPDLQKHNLEFYLPLPASVGAMMVPPNPVFATMFYQNDGEFYLEAGKASGFSEGMGPKVFETWTRFYTDYSFVLDANFINRFRSGQMPIGLTYYNTYNTLAVFAPEIRGKWDFSLVPGTKVVDSNGNETIRRETVSAVSGSMILQQSKNPEASWEFLKWWLSTEIQTRFGREMEGILGAAARYPTANVAAMESLPWTVKEATILSEQWQWTRGIPEVPGAYMTGRHLDNAFRKVIADSTNPRETIYDYVQVINKELEKKRREFGLE
ncbi:MAG: extracellular solute-binding protein [Acholeplasmataceae bacterium]|nr:extracellular solute-binding protein [Acholeplasmataceae bacterium]